MKKLISLILAFVMSIFNGTEFEEAPYKAYRAEHSQFSIADESQPDYRAYYNGEASNNDIGCRIDTFEADNACEVSWSKGKHMLWFFGGDTLDEGIAKPTNPNDDASKHKHGTYWQITDNSDDSSTLHVTFPCDNLVEIIAPADCKIMDNTTSNNCKSINLAMEGGHGFEYRIRIDGLRCWYCDSGRENALDMDKPGPRGHTVDNFRGTVIHGGEVIGYATSSTEIDIIAVTKAGEYYGFPDSLHAFYKGKATKVN